MSEKTIKSRIVHKHAVESDWQKATNFTPLLGELIVYDADESNPKPRFKVGDGVTNVNNLVFVGNDSTDADTVDGKHAADFATATGLSDLKALVGDTSVSSQISTAIATKANASDLTSHTGDTTVHITSAERTNWNAAKTHADSTHAPSDAEVNQNAFSNVTVGDTTVAADSKTDTLTLTGSNVTLTPDTTNDKITIGITKTNVTDALGYTPPIQDTTYSEAGSTLGLVKSGGDVTIESGIITVNDDSHDHVISNVDGLQSALDAKATTSDVTALQDLVGDTSVASQVSSALSSANSYTDTKVAGIVNSAPETLDTLNELATALGNDPNFATTVATQIGTKADADHIHNTATTSTNGFMSSTDKSKVDGLAAVTTAGTGSAYTATVPGITSLTAGVSFIMIPNVASASTAPTLNVNGLGAKTLKRRLSNMATAKQAGYNTTWLAANIPFRVTYDGTDWIVEGQTRPAAADLYGLTASITELNYCDGVTSNIQTQLDSKSTLYVKFGTIAAGSTSVSININNSSDYVIAVNCYISGECVLCDWADDGDGTITVSIAEAITSAINIVVICLQA